MMEGELEISKKKRTTFRTLTTKIINRIENLIINDNETELKDKLEELNDLYGQLVDKEVTLKSLNSKIESLIPETEIEGEITGSESYSEKIIKWKSRITRFIKQNEISHKNISDELTSSSNLHSDTPVIIKESKFVKLPKVTLPKFFGEPYLWTEFWNQYETAIHKNENLNNIQKFTYLKGLLGGIALNTIQGFSLTSENYDKCIELLTERFGRNDIVINSHMNKLLNLDPVKNCWNINAFRNLYDQIEINIRSLESLNVDIKSVGHLLVPIILKVIPENISLEYNRKRSSKSEFDVKELIKFIKSELEAREANNLLHNSKFLKNTNPPNTTKNYDNKNKHKYNPTASFSTSVEYNCCFCKNKHAAFCCDVISPSEKRTILKNEGRCFKCFRRSHLSSQCKSKINPCKICHAKTHHETICFQNRNQKLNKEQNIFHETELNSESENSTVVASMAKKEEKTNCTNSILLQTCEAKVYSGSLSENALILCDQGSMLSFICRDLANKLNLPIIRKEHLIVHTFGNRNYKEKTYDVTRIKMSHVQNPKRNIEIEVLITDCITAAFFPPPNQTVRHLLKKNKIFIPNLLRRKATVEILLGTNVYWNIHVGNVKKLSKNLFCVETIFGPCITGVCQKNESNNAIVQNLLYCKSDFVNDVNESDEFSDLNKQLRLFWEIEGLGIKTEKENKSLESDTLLQFERDIKFENDRYEIRLPFKEKVNISDNYLVAKRRLFNLRNRFKLDLSLYEEYKQILNMQLEEGIIEKVDPNWPTSDKLYYMPHSPVIRDDRETTKCRIVFDASSKEKGCLSLNENLHPGPNLNPNILHVLLKFRSHKIGIIADIEKAFHQISVAKEDRDVNRFLWISDISNNDIITYRMCRLGFGMTSSPFILAATIKFHSKKYENEYPLAYKVLNEDLYVDDLISGSNELNRALELSIDTKNILKEAKMNLRKWKSNSIEITEKWEKMKFVEKSVNNIVPIKVLGIEWNLKNDKLKIDLSQVIDSLNIDSITKRNILKISSKIFDPIGIITPFTIRIKILYQKMWERGLDWDEELTGDLKYIWIRWCKELQELQNLFISRYYYENVDQPGKIQLHIFCDASEAAYGAICYVRYEGKNVKTYINFVASKARVAPIKKITLPRLELLACLIGARLLAMLRNVFGKDVEYFMWSDSTVALSWIRGNAKQWKQFVSNRVYKIQDISNPQNWNHCKGLDNPADIVSRGCTATELLHSSKFFNGPDWLTLPREKWPNTRETSSKQEVNEERRSTYEISMNCVSEDKNHLTLERYSSLTRLYRVTAWICRFISNSKTKIEKRNFSELSADEILHAENFWLKKVQEESFPEIIKCLKDKKNIPKESNLHQLNPMLSEEGLLIVRGRLQKAKFTFYDKHPIVIPAKHRFTELVIKDSHEKVLHAGVSNTLVQTREKFWILRGRQCVKFFLNKCIICKRFNARPGQQVIAPLPGDRINESPPFSVTGLDFAGPLYIKGSENKYYILLFTCSVTRAIHLELVKDMTTAEFLLAFRRFISRRGLCAIIYSDNARTFKRAELELREMWKAIHHPDVKRFYATNGITWKYIAERAAWWGGFYERLVRTVKTSLRKVIGRTSLTLSELETLLVEVEAMINSRPLTYIYSELEEPFPLSPAHFLIGKRILSLPTIKVNDLNLPATKEILVKRFRLRETILNHLWKRWKNEYLLNLRSAHFTDNRKTSDFKINDVVLVHDENLPRTWWKLGKVTKTFIGRDGKIRSCEVKVNNSVIKRPVQLLYNLELNNN